MAKWPTVRAKKARTDQRQRERSAHVSDKSRSVEHNFLPIAPCTESFSQALPPQMTQGWAEP